MSSVSQLAAAPPSPRAARAAIVVALLLAFVSGISLRSGPIMLLGICFTALYSAIGMLRRRVWAAYGFGLLLILSTLAVLFFALTGQSSGGFLQVSIGTIIYLGIAGLFMLAGHGLAVSGAKRGSPLPWIVIALCFSTPFLLFYPVTIASTAMQNTLLVGDFVLANRFDRRLASGQLAAFRYPLDRTQVFIRRVAGLPGDRIHFAGATLFRNGSAVEEPYVTHHSAKPNASFDNFPAGVDTQSLQSAGREMVRRSGGSGEIVVPANKFFMLGDARDDSFDSRNWGFVDENDIVGTPKLIYDSLTPGSGKENSNRAEQAPSHRWERIFKPL